MQEKEAVLQYAAAAAAHSHGVARVIIKVMQFGRIAIGVVINCARVVARQRAKRTFNDKANRKQRQQTRKRHFEREACANV